MRDGVPEGMTWREREDWLYRADMFQSGVRRESGFAATAWGFRCDLTYRPENDDTSWRRDTQGFAARLGGEAGSSILLLVCPERHVSGRWHLHCLGRLNPVRKLHHAALERLWGKGIIWLTFLASGRAVSYCVKYAVKGAHQGDWLCATYRHVNHPLPRFD